MNMINTERLYYEKDFHIAMRDCDRFRRLRPSAVLNMFQDCSEGLTEGWGVGLGHMLDNGFIWVVARIACEVNTMPRHGQYVHFRGWAGRSQMGIYPYEYHLTDDNGHELLSGSSLWAIASVETHSMMSKDVPRLSLPSPTGEVSRLPRMKFIATPQEYATAHRRVLFSETDINGHLTNAKYMDWVCDLVPPDFHEAHPMAGLRIDYRAECRPEEGIPLDWAVDDTRLWCRSDGRFSAEIWF